MELDLAMVNTFSTKSRWTILELSTARTTKPLPNSASAKRWDSMGESELTKVSTAKTKSGGWRPAARRLATAAAPTRPISSLVDQTKVTSRSLKSGPRDQTADTRAEQPMRSSKLRALARFPASGRYFLGT